MIAPGFRRGGGAIKITSTRIGGIADFTFCIRDRLPGAHSVLYYNSAEPGGPGFVTSVDDFTKYATDFVGATCEVSPLLGATQAGRCKNCFAAQDLIAHIESGMWKAAFFPWALESWPSSIFYENAAGELTGSGFPFGGGPIKVHRAKVGGFAYVTFRIDERLPGARSVLLYKSNEAGGPGFVTSVSDFAVDAPSYVGMNVEFSQIFYG
jgi:hypothetical protein